MLFVRSKHKRFTAADRHGDDADIGGCSRESDDMSVIWWKKDMVPLNLSPKYTEMWSLKGPPGLRFDNGVFDSS